MGMKIEASADDILKLAYGGKVSKNYAEGGEVEGPSHEQGGVPVQDNQTGEQIAEVEGAGVGVDGGERIFSVEDTEAMEQAAEEIIKMMEAGQQQQAEDMAMRLGFAVVDMIAQQERSQEGQEAAMMEQMNQFGNVAE